MRDQARNPERAVSLHLARSGSQSERAIWFILPAHGASHIISLFMLFQPMILLFRGVFVDIVVVDLKLPIKAAGVARIQTGLNLCDWSRRQNSAAATMIFMKLTVSHKVICCGDLSPRRVAATYRLVCPGLYRSDKISESCVVASCVHFRQQVAATKYKWTNERASYGQPYWIRKLVHIPSHTRSLRVLRTGVVSQRLVLQVVHMEQLVAETCRYPSRNYLFHVGYRWLSYLVP